MLLGYYLGFFFCALPGWMNMYLDASAIVYLNGNPVCSPTTSEDIRVIVWLPFLPVGLVWNQWWAWTTQEKKCCRFLINEVVKKNNDLVLNPPKTNPVKTTSQKTTSKTPVSASSSSKSSIENNQNK